MLTRLLAEQLRERRADKASGSAILQIDDDFGAATRGPFAESDRARVRYVRARAGMARVRALLTLNRVRRKVRLTQSILGAGLLFAAAVTGADAQETTSVRGVVRDAASNRPLLGAVVTLGDPARARVTRTDETGAFAFAGIQPGLYTLATRRLGFEVDSRALHVTSAAEPVVVALVRVAFLDTVRIRATRQGIYGAVGSARDLRPLPVATIQVAGMGSRRLPLDSAAQFFVPIKAPGSYIVRAQAKGYQAQTVSVTVPPDGSVEIALLLDSASGRSPRIMDVAINDLDQRMRLRRSSSVLIPRSELMDDDTQMLSAIRSSRSFALKGLRFGELACVFEDGRAMPGVSLNRYQPDQVEAVEVYTASSDGTGTLGRQWPKAFPCADTGMPRGTPSRGDVQWVVIWLKH